MSVQVQLRRDTYANVAANHGAAGEVFVDTTNQRIVVQDGATNGGFPAPVTLFVGSGGSTNNSSSGSGAFVTHTPSFVIPANFLIKNRVLRITVALLNVSGSAPPNFTQQLSLAGIGLGAPSVLPQTAVNSTAQSGMQYALQAVADPSASSPVACSPVGNAIPWVYDEDLTGIQNFATNGALTLAVQTFFSAAGTGTNTVQLMQFIIEALN